MDQINFLNPDKLFFLFALILPIIVHLFNFRKVEKIFFTKTKYLEEIEEKQESLSKIKRYLLLFSRLSALLFLVFAISEPYYGKSSSDLQSNVNVIYLDNSFSMEAKYNSKELFELAKKDILDVNTFSTGKYIYLLSNNSIKTVNDNLSLNLALSEINYANIPFSFKAFQARLNDIKKRESRDLNVNLFSDLKVFDSRNENDSLNSDIFYNTILYKANSSKNVSVDTAWINTINFSKNTYEISYRITNWSEEKINYNETIFLDSNIISSINRNIKSKSDSVFFLEVKENKGHNILGQINIAGDEISFDNDLYFSINKADVVKVLHKGKKLPKSYRVLEQNSNLEISYSSQNNFKNYRLDDFSFLVYTINSKSRKDIVELSTYIKSGKKILFLIAENTSKNYVNLFFDDLNIDIKLKSSYKNLEMTGINYDSKFYIDLFKNRVKSFSYPLIESGYKLDAPNAESLLILEDGNPFLIYDNKSNCYFYSSAIYDNKNSFINTDLARLTYYKMLNSDLQNKLYYTIKEVALYKNSKYNKLDVVGDDMYEELVYLGEDNFLIQGIEKEGNFYLINESDSISNISFNNSRRENLLQISNNLEQHSIINLEQLKNQDNLIYLWKWCLTFTLLFLLMEFLVINLLKD